MQQPSQLAETILSIADQASAILLKYFKTNLSVEYKKDVFDPVTKADTESDEFIRNEIKKLFPDDLLLSEEHEYTPEEYGGSVWMIDPLNGTKSFVKGIGSFAVVIARVENGVPVFGCVVSPAQGNVFYAEKGVGAFEKIRDTFRPIHTTDIETIEEARVITREPGTDIRPIEEKLNTIPFMHVIQEGSGAKLCSIARGDAEAHINTNFRAGKWDIAAAQVILEEAGGVVTDLDGRPIDYKAEGRSLDRSFFASANKKLHMKIMEELHRLEV